MPKHIVRLVVLLAGFLGAALAAKAYFTVDSFYEFGHFRANSVPEIAAQVPVLQTPSYCVACHAERHALWSANAHKTVICEVCHGPANGHPQQRKMPVPTDTIKLCSLCHEKMPGRPAAQPQVDIAQHSSGQQCIVCHNPHAPKLSASTQAVVAGDKVAGRALAERCTGCHGAAGIASNPMWPNLAAQNSTYLTNSLRAFKTGTRTDAMMQPIAQALSGADMQNLAAHFSALPCQPAANPPDDKAQQGKTLATACANCHGEHGISANPAWPNLAGQNETYLANALHNFKSGTRNDALMSRIAAPLSDTDIAALAHYFQTQACVATTTGGVAK
jgi:cytochrome c553